MINNIVCLPSAPILTGNSDSATRQLTKRVPMSTTRRHSIYLPTFAAALAASLLFFQPANAQENEVQIVVDNVRDDVFMLTGRGGNIGLSVGSDGPLIIDDQFAELSDKIVAAIATVSDQPVKFVVNTHHHGDHTGGNANFNAAGAIVVAHDKVRDRMQAAQLAAADGASPAALPVITFSHDATFHWNGQTTKIHHVAPAHTDGDAIVYFEEANVIHMGDTYFAGRYPYIDVSSGGDIDGVIEAADYALSISNAETLIIPGHGALSNPTELQTYRSMLVDVRLSVKALIADGKTLDEALAMNPTRQYDAGWGGGFVNAERFVSAAWTSLGGSIVEEN